MIGKDVWFRHESHDADMEPAMEGEGCRSWHARQATREPGVQNVRGKQQRAAGGGSCHRMREAAPSAGGRAQ
jgi:hypothetical protein